jgi:hypothetical protein
VWDAHGEPIAWLAVGEPVAGTMYGGAGMVAYTHLLTVEEAVDVYGPISEWVVGPQGGFRRSVSARRCSPPQNLDVASMSARCLTVSSPSRIRTWSGRARGAVPIRANDARESPNTGFDGPMARNTGA